jgi:pyroglutamyl-peptidase
MAQKKLLISGFEAFAGLDFNPTAHLANKFGQTVYNKIKIETAVLPVSFESTFKSFQNIYNEDYIAIIMCGLAYSRPWWSLEQVGKNLIVDNRPDNDGHIQKDKKQINTDGKNAVYSSIDLHLLNKKLKARGLPSEVSMDAGTYVCNYLFYRVASLYKQPSFFLHIPANQELKQDSKYSLKDLENNMDIFIDELTQLL